MENIDQIVLAKFKATVIKYGLIRKGDSVLIACSGGPDSVSLVHLILRIKAEYNLKIKIIHFQHRLRGRDSERDELFVRRWVKELGEQLLVKQLNVSGYARKTGTGIEQAGRELRYRWLEKISSKGIFNRVALGHTLDDQAETVIGNLLRGTGSLGLAGIPPIRSLTENSKIIRPLLFIKRKEIEKYLKFNELSFRRDKTNIQLIFRRNRIRHRLLPLLEKYNLRIKEHLSHLADISFEENSFWMKKVEKAFPKVITKLNHQTAIDLSKLIRYNRILQVKLLQCFFGEKIDFLHLRAIRDLIEDKKASGAVALPGGWARKEYRFLFFISGKRGINRAVYPLVIPGDNRFPELRITLQSRVDNRPKSFRFKKDKNWAYFDWEKLEKERFFLRFRQPGDRFQPFGVVGSKKLKKFFIDQKIPHQQRDEIPLLVTEQDILWVVGRRSSGKFKVKPDTKKVLEIAVKNQIG